MRVQFRLTIENRGKGEVISPIRIDEVKLANRRLSCKGPHEQRPWELLPEDLEEKRNVVVCTILEPRIGAYTTTLSASIFYTYRTKEKGEFLIRGFQG